MSGPADLDPRWITDADGDPAGVPAGFFRQMSERELTGLIKRNGVLTPKQCRRLWQMLGRTGPAPRKVQLYLSRADVERLWPSKDRMH